MTYNAYIGSFDTYSGGGGSNNDQYGARFAATGGQSSWASANTGGGNGFSLGGSTSWAIPPAQAATRYGATFDDMSSRPMDPMRGLNDMGGFSQPASLMSLGGYGATWANNDLVNVGGAGGAYGGNQMMDGYGRRDRDYGRGNGGFRNDRGGGYRSDRRDYSDRRTFPSRNSNSRDSGRKDRRDSGRKDSRDNDKKTYDKRRSGGSSGEFIPSRIALVDRKTSGRTGGDRNGGTRDTNRRFQNRSNRSTDIKFATIPDDVPSKTFTIRSENLVCFHGLQSVFATQHKFPIVIDGFVYESVDHFYQIEKVRQLVTGKSCDSLEATVKREDDDTEVIIESGGKNFGQLAREFLKENKVDRSVVEEWRRSGGVVATQTAMTAKASQCSELRESLTSSANKMIVHTYAGDAIFGSGNLVQYVHKWADEMSKSGAKLTIPLCDPLTDESIAYCPTVAKGRNLLGVILMQLADKVVKSELLYIVTSAALEHDKSRPASTK